MRQVVNTVDYPCHPRHEYVSYGDDFRWEFGIVYYESTKIYATEYIIPKGFFSDGASIPKVLRSIFDPFARDILSSAVVHDYMLKLWREGKGWQYGIKSRKDCDKIFFDVMKCHDVNRFKMFCLYTGVRIYTFLKGGFND